MDANVTPITPNNAAAERVAAEGTGGAMSRFAAMPARAKMMLALGLAGLVAVLVSLFLWNGNGNLAPLYPNLSEKDAGAVISQLATLKVPYKAAGDGTTLMVPAEMIPELRLKLAQAGLPKGTTAGFELMDNARFGQSQLQERTNLQRALEGELVRSITSISAVQTARVHLALPSQNGFFREQQKPSASVMLTLHPGRTLDRAQVAGIVHLVSSSVPDLSVKAVSIVDQNSSLLSAPPEAGHQGLDTQQLQYLQQVEASYLKRVIEILEPALGRDNLRATVTAEMDFNQLESTTEEFKPNQAGEATIRSSRSAEASNAATATPSGVPGAASNQPPTAAAAPLQGAASPLQAAQTGSAGGNGRKENTVNYEVDKTVSMKRQAVGAIKRINAAVLVNHRGSTDAKGKTTSTALTPEELDKLTSLVRESIGFNKDRGDSVKVVNIPFRVEAAPKIDEVPMWKQPWLVDLVRASAVPAGLTAVALMLVFAVVRPALRQIVPPPAPKVLEALVDDTMKLPEPVIEEPLILEQPKTNRQLEGARLLARDNPAAVANIVRNWVSGEVA
ncbi:flagellar basal-body MS-ring/collar protein FliF [Aquabacterium sp.]|uniref:flagellar basal-body MS-ring/collar protein FliF n=1 Tax=Aquabacterium sp. TaxID=1872578 RepID=UPI002C6D2B6E|nr:flagellar basal-body MS-ring/collar protein FliF [Aquabacterium sp.]HSW04647.1 flagellar basal-body MS-ring/collar protein FliF [Aquabacterium sp.]